MGNCVQTASHVENGRKMKRNTTFHTFGADEMSISSNDSDGYSPHSRNTCALEVWEPISFLGDGSIATVHLARRRPQRAKIPYIERSDIMTRAMKASGQSHGAIDSGSGGPSASVVQVCALKSIHQDHVGSNTILRDAKDEISILRKLSHPNIVRLLEGFERRRHVYMATEVCQGGDLHQVEGTSEAQAKAIVRQILSAVSYMHQMGVVHRDLKLANVLFANKDQKEVKIIDFGMAVEHKDGSEKLSKRVGTIYSMAPEVLKGSYDCKCDMWSVGIIAYILLCGSKPFWGPNVDIPWSERRLIMIERILRADYVEMKGEKWDMVSDDAKTFVKSLLQLDPDQRPSAKEALQLPWMQTDDGTALEF